MTTSNAFIFDIETVPLSGARLALLEPEHEAPGNFKDPEKIAAAIAEKSRLWREKAALSPLTGRVAMIGMGADPLSIRHLVFSDPDDEALDKLERHLLTGWWSDVRA